MRRRLKTAIITAGLAVVSMAVSGCGKSSIYEEDGSVHLRMAQASAADGAIGISMEKFAEEVKEKSDGRITISVFIMDSWGQKGITLRHVNWEIWI